ncbi:cobalamin-binding protein [Propionivibrio dicarboxylicus]|uniref:Iron complex transport system substrate-binding protein n=1 Tax=Propionivibrio dicarboxylicus TaxID=83767 RepID=A0A1G8EN99_9RHOO|nr:cobalamin-binding protein [Propionivibrio dicarboxylicus]SDH71356.1 iron complex transport system substrate-binding protein [Propionivibrio dicarboxylicus]
MLKFFAVIFFGLLPCLASADVSVRDDSGSVVRLARPAQRIITLAPHLVETVFAAGAGSQLVGTVEYSSFPEEVKKVPRVGGYSRLDLEAVVALKPDLVIAWQSGNSPAHVEKLRQLGLPIYISQPNRIEDIASEIERIGVLAGTTKIASSAAKSFLTRLTGLQTRYGGRPTVRTFYQVWHQPLKTIGRTQIISNVIRMCGGENVFGNLDVMAPEVTVEAVLAANPEVIIASGMGEARPEWLDEWKLRTGLIAAQRQNLFFIPPDLIQRHTPRLLDGAEQLCRHLETARTKRPSGAAR